MTTALAIAFIADALQFFAGPYGWVGFDQMVDLIAMILCMWILGFHVLLLPTFVAELVPIIDQLPTWTACVAAVIALRKRDDIPPPPVPPVPPTPSVIDV